MSSVNVTLTRMVTDRLTQAALYRTLSPRIAAAFDYVSSTDFAALAEGIARHLYTLPGETVVFPGHGPESTLGRERRTNPYVAERG